MHRFRAKTTLVKDFARAVVTKLPPLGLLHSSLKRAKSTSKVARERGYKARQGRVSVCFHALVVVRPQSVRKTRHWFGFDKMRMRCEELKKWGKVYS